jgi:hypothetical protein
MISKPLLKQTIKSNIKPFLIITAEQCGLLSIIMTVFTPTTMDSINKSYLVIVGNRLIAGQVSRHCSIFLQILERRSPLNQSGRTLLIKLT